MLPFPAKSYLWRAPLAALILGVTLVVMRAISAGWAEVFVFALVAAVSGVVGVLWNKHTDQRSNG